MSSERRKPYPFDQFEPKWQAIWEKEQTFHTPNPGEKDFDPAKPKFYVLDMFPYPSGAGLHVGHPEGYTATDIVARYRRLCGFNVLHPMGWDAFGLPAEQYAIKTGQHPAVTTGENIAKFKSQLKAIGFSYDWQREVNTTDPRYYRWTQWIFLKIYNSYFDYELNKAQPIELLEDALSETPRRQDEWKDNAYLVGTHRGAAGMSAEDRARFIERSRLAYVAEVPVNWCPDLGTVLANEEVIDGRSEVGGHPVVRRPMRQWMLRITAYADRLIDELEGLDWPESIKLLQRNWIGKSEGAEVQFPIVGVGENGKDARPDGAARLPHQHGITVFTTRPDTLYGATYMVLAPEHSLVDQIVTEDQWPAVREYRERTARKSELERTDLAKEKTGVFTGAFAINPVTQERIPIWIADYVLLGYGTGAIMAVPAHDERDLEFARKFDLPIRIVVKPPEAESAEELPGSAGGPPAASGDSPDALSSAGRRTVQAGGLCSPDQIDAAFIGNGVAINSPVIDGLPTPEAKKKIATWLEEHGLGKRAINYKLRDWLFSRQRYWGEPFPIVWEDKKHRALTEEELPLEPPPLDDFKPTGTGEPPLAKSKEWVRYSEKAVRETNTMPQWAGSCWYYLRFCDPQNDQRFVGEEAERYWMGGGTNDEAPAFAGLRRGRRMTNDEAKTKSEGRNVGGIIRHSEIDSTFGIQHSSFPAKPGGVDLYVGGTEHAVLHLLYARFWHKVLFDLGYLSKPEPFQRLVNQGMILGEDSRKMSKRWGNVIDPLDVIAEYGADAFRCYEMFMGPLEQMKPWSMRGVEGLARFLARVWRLVMTENQAGDWELSDVIKEVEPDKAQQKITHATIKKVTEDIETLSLNTAIAQMMIFVNAFTNAEVIPLVAIRTFLILLNPFAPHISSELWQVLNGKFPASPAKITAQSWPSYDELLLVEDEVEIAVQINGKVRDRLTVSIHATEEEIKALVLALPKIQQLITGKTVRKVVVVPKKLVNIVVS